nr:putative serine protease K12H4.7 [Helicoverpa armigera]
MIIFLLFLSLLSPSWAKEPRLVEMSLGIDMKPPEEISRLPARNVNTAWTTMPLDHFDHQNPTNFSMRFMFNEQFFGGDGYPIFILVGGEWDIHPGWLTAGNMFEMARENKGYQVYTEHRYYGASKIFANFTAENLRFLNIDQALADLAYFITDMKKQPRFADSKVILYGGSYAANMVMWFKMRYPHLVVGTVASSGPILAKVDFFEYLEVVHEAFWLEGGEQCIAHIRQGIEETVASMQTEEGRRRLEQAYRLCEPLNYDNVYDLGQFSGLISWTFSTSVQQAFPGSLISICNNFNDNTYGSTPMEKIGGYIARIRNLSSTSCWQINYQSFLNSYMLPTNSRAWYYQTCTEYGFYQTAPTSGTVFDGLKWLSLDFYVDICKKIFDERFDEAFVKAGADRVNLVFGALAPEVKNTINIHGYIDPWRALGVYKEDVSDTSPTYTVDRASHCFDMRAWSSSDTIAMTAVQQRARRIVASWLS